MKKNEESAFDAIIREEFMHAVDKLGIPEDAAILKKLAGEFTRLMMEMLRVYIENLVRRSR